MINIGAPPSPDFTDPIGLLSDCHRRIERFLNILVAVTDHAYGGSLNDEQREALETALRYFREAAPKHTSDEEESLFPRLRALRHPHVDAALDTVENLQADHRAAAIDHAEVDTLTQRWLTQGQLNPGATRELAGRLHELRALYEHHIAVEDTKIFPLAKQVLSAADITAVGREMARRRGLQAQAPAHLAAAAKSRCTERAKATPPAL